MQPKLMKTGIAEYIPGTFTGQNESGWTPVGDRILVLTDQIPSRSSGGIMYTDDYKEHASQAAETGILVAVGDGAFVWNADRTRPFSGRKPQPGDYVQINRYSGQTIMGNDGQLYRLMDENCLGAVK